MASSSISSIHMSFKYDVFLSFRGEDTRKNFVDHLYHALQHKSIETYKDDEKIKKGNRISGELLRSIEDSKFYIIVFSKNYASSSWCLDELVKMMECHKTTEHTAYPIFYDVEPTEVRNQSGAVGKAFAKHEKKAAAGKWRNALEEAAGLAGWELKHTANGHEAKFIQKVVDQLSLELRSINFNIDENLVGMETRIQDLVSSLGSGFDDVRLIGIKGIGGGGKTTLARAVFDKISWQFEGKSFVENVREVSKDSSSGLKSLQRQILSDVLIDKDISISGVHDGKNLMQRVLRNRKVLIVLDDVDGREQLEALAGKPSWFQTGSIIIITTRDEQVLIAHNVKLIHDVMLLSDMEAICLFSRYAFGREIPMQGYEELSGRVIRYADGLPLTITVLGSFLCGKDMFEWRDALDRLKTIPLNETLMKLELSYTGLEEDYKEIFLDVACILKGWRKTDAIKALESRGFHARNGLRVLEQKSLITISISYGEEVLSMHDHIEEMGKNIVRRLHPDKPNQHSRLWINNEIEDILSNDSGTEATRCILFCNTSFDAQIVMKGLRKMKELRFLCADVGSYAKLTKYSPYFPNALRFLSWENYPFRSLPKTFQATNLVALKMRHSDITQLWEGEEKKVLNTLKVLDLSCSMLLSTLDLGLTPNIETLNLDHCFCLVELHMPIVCLKLRSFYISHSKLRTLDLRMTPNVEHCGIENCSDLVELLMPDRCLNLRDLKLRSSRFENLDIGLTPNLKYLNLECSWGLEELRMPGEYPNLTYFNISFSPLRTLDLGTVPNLENLHIEECHHLVVLRMPSESRKLQYINFRGLESLRILHLGTVLNLEHLHIDKYCDKLEELHMSGELRKHRYLKFTRLESLRTLHFGTVLNLEHLHIEDCHKLEEVHMSGELRKLHYVTFTGLESLKTLHTGPPQNLKHLKLNHLLWRTLDLWKAPDLESLHIKDCDKLEEVHMPGQLQMLRCLNLTRLESLRTLCLSANLEKVFIDECYNLVELHMPGRYLNLNYLQLCHLKCRTLDLGVTPNLEYLEFRKCYNLEELQLGDESPKLTSLIISDSRLRTLDLRMVPNLESLILDQCKDLVELHIPGRCLNLKTFELTNSKLRTLDIGLTPDLEDLHLTNCYELEELHMAKECQKLTSLNISYSRLRTFDLGMVPNLKSLILDQCNNLVELHMPGRYLNLTSLKLNGSMLRTREIGRTPNVEYLDIQDCYDLEELHLADECQKLESINISGSRLRTLDLGLAPNLKTLILDGCNDLVEIHMPGRCLNLTSIKLTNSKLRIFDIGIAPNLEYLDLKYCFNLEEFHVVGEYQKLRFLELSYSNLRTLDLGLALNLQTLILDECNDLVELHMPGGSVNLTSLELTNSKLRTLDLGLCPNLEKLNLANNSDLEELHMADGCPQLTSIDVSHSKLSALDLGLIPNLEKLDLKGCNNLVELQVPMGCLKKLVYLDLSGCLRFRYFSFQTKDGTFFSVDESLTIGPSAELHLIAESLDICPIHLDNNLPKFEFRCFYKEYVPSLTRNLEKLISLGLCTCTNLERFSRSICGLQCLRKLKLEGSIPEAPKDLDQLRCLEELSLSSTKITYLPENICMMKHLKSLVLNCCSLLGKLPDNIGRLECLETLILMECEILRDIPDSICKMNSLKHFHLRNCIRVEKLPEELGRLQRLNELVIEGTSISHLPQSILLLKGLCVVGSRELLQLFGFTSEIQTLEDLMFCYVEV